MQVGADLVADTQNRHKMKKRRFFMSKRDTQLVIEDDTVYAKIGTGLKERCVET